MMYYCCVKWDYEIEFFSDSCQMKFVLINIKSTFSIIIIQSVNQILYLIGFLLLNT